MPQRRIVRQTIPRVQGGGMSGDFGRRVPNAYGEPAALHCSGFRVGGVSVQVAGNHDTDVSFVRSLEPFRIQPDSSDISGIKIQVEWVEKLSHAQGRELFDSGSIWRLFEDEAGFRFEFSTPICGKGSYKRLIVDDEFRRATLLLSQESFRDRESAAPLEYPLDEVLITHRLAREKAIELHGCGIVGPDYAGNLFVGHSGAGKSTTARLWTTCEDVEVLSDDRIIVRWDEVRPDSDRAEMETPCRAADAVEGIGILRLRGNFASRSSCSAQDDKVARAFAQDGRVEKQIPPLRSAQGRNDKGKIRMYGTPWHGEAMYASPASAPLSRICILEHGRGNVLTRLSPSQAVAELFARSFVPFHRHEYLETALEFLQEVVEAVPCYRFAFEPDQGAVDTILNLHD